ncbi:MAG: sulfotransferase [Cyanobacteria bacterium P01_A01_bin.114]
MKSSIQKRLFLVGCPRSGTTLLQSFLASHAEIKSFPESHFFRHLLEKQTPVRKQFGVAPKDIQNNFAKFLLEADAPAMVKHIPKRAIFSAQYACRFAQILDEITQQAGQSIWLEKTPDHLFYADYIEKHIDSACFIHILRKGSDVVASLYEVAQKYPQVWHGPWTIDYCIKKWLSSVELSLKQAQKENHLLVSYEQFINDPQAVLKTIFDFLDIKFEYEKLVSRQESCQLIGATAEPWKAAVSHSIYQSSDAKFQRIFNRSQQTYIQTCLQTYLDGALKMSVTNPLFAPAI